MYCCVFWCEIIDLVGFLAVLTLFIYKVKAAEKNRWRSEPCLFESSLRPKKPFELQIFLTRGKPLSSLHHSKCLKAKYPHACHWK